MLKRLLFLSFIWAMMSTSLLAQTTYFNWDFSEGPGDWTIESNLCETIDEAHTGTWTLSTLLYNNALVENVTAELSISTQTQYMARISGNGVEAWVQAGYEIVDGTMETNITGATFPLDGFAYDDEDDQTTWASNMNADSASVAQWGATLAGIGDPNVSISGNILTLTSQDGLAVAQYQRSNSCGGLWFWSHNGNVGNGVLAAAGTEIESPTADNGSMVFNPDFLVLQGDDDALNNLPDPLPGITTSIVSPSIDMSSITGAVALEFSQLARLFFPPEDQVVDASDEDLATAVSFSIDGGDTWSTPVNANPSLGYATTGNPLGPFNSTESVNIPAEYIGQSDVRIRLTGNMTFYYWVLDDIKVVSRINYDMQANDNWYGIAPNAVTPITQLEDFYFIGDIQNNGGRTATGVEYNLTIRNAQSGAEVYNSTNTYPDMAPDDIQENYIFPDALEPASLEVGTFTGTYTVSHDSLDDITDNNEITFNFEVSESTFAKDFGSTRNVTPADDNTFVYGNAYFTPNATFPDGEQIFIKDITFGVANADDLAAAGASATTYLYEWDGDTNDDGQANADEYSLVAINSYPFQSGQNNTLVTIPVSFEDEVVPVQAGKYYLAMVGYEDESADGDLSCFLLASEDFDYFATFFTTDSLNQARYGSFLEVGTIEDPDLSRVGFGFDIVPVVRLNLDGPVAVNETIVEDRLMDVFPNPANEFTQVRIDLEAAQEAQILITDAAGRLVKEQHFESVRQADVRIDVSDLAAGTYFVRLNTEAGANIKPLVIQR